MGACQGSNKERDKKIRDERVRTEPDQGRGSDAFTGPANVSGVSRKSQQTKIDQNIPKKYSMKKQESLKVTLSLTQGPMSKYYTKKNLRYLEGVNFKDNMYVVQHKVTGKIRIAETFEKNPRNTGFIHKIIQLQLNHPNLLDIYAIFEENEYILIMDYCNGGTLQSLIQQKTGKLSDQQMAYICRQIYDLMNYLHRFGLIHGSLNLKSFEKWNQGKQLKIKLTDFSAFFCRPELNLSSAQFLCPECCNEKLNYTLQRDFWAVGMITMVVCFGKCSFDGISIQEIIEQIQTSCKKDGFIAKELEKLVGNHETKELIGQLLQVAPSKRIDLQQALESKWMKNYDLISKTVVQQYLGELSKKQDSNFLQSCFLLMIIKQFDDKLIQVQEIFNGLDTDKNGRLTKPELTQSYQKYFNTQYSQNEISEFVNEIFDASDLNHNGDIELSEFLLAMANKKSLITQENLKIIFDQINCGNPIGLDSLLPLFKNKEKELQEALKGFQNQEIQYEEFVPMMFELVEDK